MTWWVYALLGAVAAGATAILAKIGVGGVPPNLAVAIRTAVVLLLASGLAMLRGEHGTLRDVRSMTLTVLVVSGITTAISWLAYFKALQLAPASWVAPLDKMSLPITILLAVLVLGEKFTWHTAAGAGLMTLGALLIVKP